MSNSDWHEAQKLELTWWSAARDRLASSAFIDQKKHAALELWKAISSMLPERPLHVLEVGTGGDALVNFIPDSFCVGLEPLIIEMKRQETGIFLPSVNFVCGVGERLPFRDNSFDVVFSYNVLDHTFNPEMGLDEIARVLRVRGVIYILLDSYSMTFKLYRRLYRPDPMHPHTFTPREVYEMLASRGFRVAADVSDRKPAGKRRHRAIRAFCVLDRKYSRTP